MKKGDLVVLSSQGKGNWRDAPSNPHNEIGRLHSIYGSGNCQVIWKACTNSYGKGDIVQVNPDEVIGEVQVGPVRCASLFLVEK